MSGTIQVANIHLESTGNNRIQYDDANSYSFASGGNKKLLVNTSQLTVNNDIKVNDSFSLTIGNSVINSTSLSVGANVSINTSAVAAPTANASDRSTKVATTAFTGQFVPRGHIWGSRITWVSGNTISISPGQVADNSGTYMISWNNTITKNVAASWASGNNTGSLDTGSITSNTYFVHVVANTTTLTTDFVTSLSNSSPTLPANFNISRCIGFFLYSNNTIPFDISVVSARDNPDSIPFILNDDSAISFEVGSPPVAVLGIVTQEAAERTILFNFDTAGDDQIAMVANNGNCAVSTSVLTGTTGTDGTLTVSVNNNVIYIENRTGGRKNFHFSTIPSKFIPFPYRFD